MMHRSLISVLRHPIRLTDLAPNYVVAAMLAMEVILPNSEHLRSTAFVEVDSNASEAKAGGS
jgi:hypothetical protein